MNAEEWNKKEDLLQDQGKLHIAMYDKITTMGRIIPAKDANIHSTISFAAVRHLKKYVILFAAFTTNFKSELHLLNKIQEYCYDNMNFIKSFNKIVLLLYKSKFRFFLLISSRKWFAYDFFLQRSKFL